MGVLGERYGAKFASPVKEFVFGKRAVWEGGLQKKLGARVRRSVEEECTLNDGGKWKAEYEYFARQPAQAARAPYDEQYDKGHDGWTLDKFRQLAKDRGAALTLVETAVLRMYTGDLYVPWNNALRGLDTEFNKDNDAALGAWATCIAVLFSAVIPDEPDDATDPTVEVW